MTGLSKLVDDSKDKLVGFTDDLSSALDFGDRGGASEPIKATNPEKDLTALDRSNPVNVEFAPFGVNKFIWIGAAGILALIVLKKTKVI